MSKYKIKYGDKEFDASEYQEKIFDFIIEGAGDLLINASAGSSKTTTIINCLDKIKDKRVLFVAFNRSIVKEIKEKIGIKDGTNISTFHGLGFSILSENFALKENCVDEYKYKNYLKNNLNRICPIYRSFNKKNQHIYVDNIIKLIDYSRYYLVNRVTKIQKIAKKYNLELLSNEADVCIKILDWGSKNIETIDYTDMVWLPNVLNLVTKKYTYDWVFIDEGQDTSVMEEQLISKCKRRGARTVIVGDKEQQINVWAGSSEESFEKYIKDKNTLKLDLPICYRCPKKIIEIAKQFSTRIQEAPNAIDGEVRYNVSKNDPISGDMVLCRTTAPLIDLHLNYIRLNKKSYIKGSEEIQKNLLDYISESDAKEIGLLPTKKNDLISDLYRNLLEEFDEIKEKYGLDDEDTILHPEILKRYDGIEAIKVISEGLTNVDELIDKINVIFLKCDEGISLSTVHKAKGLEADNVYILYKSLMPSSMAKEGWEMESEKNLQYVATTRAKKTLNYIREENRWNINKGYMNPQSMLALLKSIEKQVGYIKKIAP